MIITYLQVTGRPIFGWGHGYASRCHSDVNISFKQFLIV